MQGMNGGGGGGVMMMMVVMMIALGVDIVGDGLKSAECEVVVDLDAVNNATRYDRRVCWCMHQFD